MVKSFNQLKKDLTVGTKIKVITHTIRPEVEGIIKTITKKQTNGFYTSCKDYKNGANIWLEFPTSANLIEYTDNVFSIYDMGTRDLNEQEKEFLKESYNKDYFGKLSLAKKMNIPYMASETNPFIIRYNKYQNKIYTNKIKGNLLFTFEILKENNL